MIIKGVNPLPAHGRAGARATFLLAARPALRGTKFGGGKARTGPEGETSFPYGVNKNSCFLLTP